MKVGNEVRSKMKKLKKRKENITLMKKILHESKKNKGKKYKQNKKTKENKQTYKQKKNKGKKQKKELVHTSDLGIK